MGTPSKTGKKIKLRKKIRPSRNFPARPTASGRSSSRITTTSFTSFKIRFHPQKNQRGKMRISECGCLGNQPKEPLRQREGPAVIFWREPSVFHSAAPRPAKASSWRGGKRGGVKVSPASLASPGKEPSKCWCVTTYRESAEGLFSARCTQRKLKPRKKNLTRKLPKLSKDNGRFFFHHYSHFLQ